MGKAKRRNAYFCFMLDFKRREEGKGIVFAKGFEDVACFASDAWKNLPQSERDRYKKIAEDYNKSEERERGLPAMGKKKSKSVLPVKSLTTKEAKKIAEKEYIKNLLESLDTEQLLDQLFYLIHVNVFCKTDDDEYFPAEIALSKFTLRDGPLKVFHRFLNAGEIPMGYSYEVKRHSEGTHRIPLDLMKAGKGYLGMYQSILNFLQETNPNEIPPLYTMFDEPFHNCSMSAVKHSLKRIWETQNTDIEEEGEVEDDEPYEKVFKVYSLPILFFHLKEKCAKLFNDGMAFPNTSLANLELLKDRYSFDSEIACTFHQDNDNVQYCSQSYTVRWARVIREQCCKFLEDEEEEEVEEVITPAVVPLKDEKLDLPIKDEKDAIKKEIPGIKIEKDVKKELHGIKTEKDDVRVKTERSESAAKTERDGDSVRIKTEKERDGDSVRIKTEKERDGDSVRIKTEKDRGYDDRRVKTEKDRGYDDRSRSHRDDDIRVKTEKDRGYSDERRRTSRDRDRSGDRRRSHRDDDVRVKSERGDDRRRHRDDDRIKKERNRGYDDERRSRDRYDDRRRYRDDRDRRSSRDEDVRIKKEKDRGYDDRRHREDEARIKTEKDNDYDNRPTPPRDQFEVIELNEPVRVKIEKPDYDSVLKSEHIDIPFTPLKDERLLSNTGPHFSGASAPVEQPQQNLTIEPVRVKIEKQDYDYILKTEHVDIPYVPKDEYPFSNARDPRSINTNAQARDPRLQNQTSRDPRLRGQASTSQAMPMVIKSERTDQSRSHDFPLPIPMKVEIPERSNQNRKNDFPLPIPIKVEISERSNQIRNDDFPLPIPLKVEIPERNNQNRNNDFPLPIPMKVEIPERNNQNRNNDFPLPIPMKVEKLERSNENRQESDFPMAIKTEKPDKSNQNLQPDFPNPKIIKTEKSPEVQTAPGHGFPMPIQIKKERTTEPQSAAYRNEFPLPIRIKEEREGPTEIKTELSDTNKRKMDSTGYDTIKRQRPGGSGEETVVKNEPIEYDECPPTPRREDFPEFVQRPELSVTRIKAEPSIKHEFKQEAVHLDSEGNVREVIHERWSRWEPMDCDPCEVPRNQNGTGAGDCRKAAKKEFAPVKTKEEDVVKDEMFTSCEDID